jgi:D-aminoacyl-tRNA deacylase
MYAHVDRKGISAAERDRITGLLKELGATVLGENEIRKRWSLTGDFCPLKVNAPVMGDGKPATITDELVKALGDCRCIQSGEEQPSACHRLVKLETNDELLALCMRFNRVGTVGLVSGLPLAYRTGKGGGKPVILWAVYGDDTIVGKLAAGLLELLAGRGTLEFDRETSVLTLVESKFDPSRAGELGIKPGPDYSILAGGKPVKVGGRTVFPDDVLIEVKTEVVLRYFSGVVESLLCEK